MPAFKGHNASSGVPNTSGPHIGFQFSEVPPYFEERNLNITGITKDSAGVVLGGCTVQLFDKITDLYWGDVISDANGNFMIDIPKGLSQPQVTTWYLVAYKAGSPDVVGTTVDILVGT